MPPALAQHRQPGLALHQPAHARTVERALDQVALPNASAPGVAPPAPDDARCTAVRHPGAPEATMRGRPRMALRSAS